MEGGDASPVLEALFEGAPAGLAYWDTDARYRRVNPRQAEIDGLPAEAHIGLTPTEVLGVAGEAIEALIRRVVETGLPAVEVEVAVELAGTRYWLASFFPVPATGGVGGIVADVTGRKAIEAREHAARARAEALAKASAALTSSMRADRVLAELVRAVVPTLADFCTIHLARPDGSVALIAAGHFDPELQDAARELGERQAAGEEGPVAVIRSGERLVTDAPSASHPQDDALLRRLGTRAAAILPLTARGQVLGAITLAMGASGRSYGPDLEELAESLAAGAGLALDNARLFAEQTEVARSLQRTLLPSELPRIPGVQLAARYRASGRSNQVGGDFYDVFDAGDGEWAVVIGDVVGKGAEAAAITSLVRATLQAAVLRGDGAADALRLVDEALRRRPTVQFCSAVHGRLRVTGEGVSIRLFAAGHPPPLIVRAVGTVETVEAAGTLLGVAPEPTFGEAEVLLGPGDALLLYTDGATELRGQDPWRGETVLRETLLASAGRPVAELVERVEHQALVLSGGELRDDLALLAIGTDAPGAD
jgi:Stage II sporulation protein E (SpoIIE)/PAS fold/GAF domain